MSVFSYKALQSDGCTVEGRVDAGSRGEACRHLDGRGLIPIKVQQETPESPSPLAKAYFQRGRKTSPRALQDFTHLLSNLLQAGVPLSRALQILCNESSAAAGKQWKALRDHVIDGWSLADAMAQFPETFSGIYIAMVRAGEAGGFLDLVLEQIAELQSRDRELRSRVLSALIYPMVLLLLAIGVLIFLLVFFIPRFESIFVGFDAALPLLTRLIVGASEMAQRYGFFILAGLGVAGIGLQRWLHSTNGRRTWDRLVLRMPVIGPLHSRFAMTRFCRMFGTLIGAGVPLINALRVARESIGNQTLTDTINGAVERVQKGDLLSASLKDCPELFPSSVIEMVAVAEETGRLDKEFVRVASRTEKDLDRRLRMAVALAEPLTLFMIAAFIGVIFIGMVIPIFSLQDYIK